MWSVPEETTRVHEKGGLGTKRRLNTTKMCEDQQSSINLGSSL